MRILSLLSQMYINVCGGIVNIGLLGSVQKTEIRLYGPSSGNITLIGAIGINEGLGIRHSKEIVNLRTVGDDAAVKVHH